MYPKGWICIPHPLQIHWIDTDFMLYSHIIFVFLSTLPTIISKWKPIFCSNFDLFLYVFGHRVLLHFSLFGYCCWCCCCCRCSITQFISFLNSFLFTSKIPSFQNNGFSIFKFFIFVLLLLTFKSLNRFFVVDLIFDLILRFMCTWW